LIDHDLTYSLKEYPIYFRTTLKKYDHLWLNPLVIHFAQPPSLNQDSIRILMPALTNTRQI